MILRASALILIVTALLIVQHAAGPIFEQNRKVRQWPGVTATVTARYVDPPRRTGQANQPRGLPIPPQLQVQYAHEVGGALYRRIVTTPRAEEWMPAGPGLITNREASYTRQAYYDPAKPAELFLPKPLGIGDYWPILFWGPLLALGFGGLLLRKPGHSTFAVLERERKGWYRLRPKYSIRLRASAGWGVAIVCNLVVGLAVFDYFTGQPRARTNLGNAFACAALLPGVFAVGFAAYYTWLAGRVGEPRVWIDTARVKPGTRFGVRVELPVKRSVALEHATISLACVRAAIESVVGKPGWRERVVWEQSVDAPIGRRAAAGQHATFDAELQVPSDADPGSASGAIGPWIDWEIRVAFKLDNGPDYRGKFAVPVDA